MSFPKRRSRKTRLRDDRLARRRSRLGFLRFFRVPGYVILYGLVAGGAYTAYHTGDLVGGLALFLAYALAAMALNLHGLHRWLPGFRGARWRVERAIALAGYSVVLMICFGYAARQALPSTPLQYLPPASVAAPKENEAAGPVASGRSTESGRAAVPVFAADEAAEEDEGFYSRVTGVPAAGVVTLDGMEDVVLLGILSPAAEDPRYADAAEVLRALAQGQDVRVKLWAGGPESEGHTAGLVWVMGGGEKGDEFLLNTELVRMGYALLSPPPGAPAELQVPGALPEQAGGAGVEESGATVIPH